MSETQAAPDSWRMNFDRLLGEMRPRLHRYCARMTGSVIDGEDVVQEALMKAIEARPGTEWVVSLEAWFFRIVHNAAIDFLRRRARRDAVLAEEDAALMPDPTPPIESREAAAASLRTFMRLPAAQRSSIILMDVLGYTIQEVADITETTVPAVKAALHRGRTTLRALAQEPEDRPAPALAGPERARLFAYIDRFNARDFDAVRAMLAEEVRLDLVNRVALKGKKEVGAYFTNYARIEDWRLVAGLVDGRPAVMVRDADDPHGRLAYFVLLDWTGDRLARIRDFRFARYAMEGAELVLLA